MSPSFFVKYPRVPAHFDFLIARQCPPRSAVRGSLQGQGSGVGVGIDMDSVTLSSTVDVSVGGLVEILVVGAGIGGSVVGVEVGVVILREGSGDQV